MAKRLFIIGLLFFVTLAFEAPECGDGVVYASLQQTEFDDRFDEYAKIKKPPKFDGGEKKLRKLIYEQLKVSQLLQGNWFMENFQLTVNCDGSITDIKELGDPKAKGSTNIIEIIRSTEGMWTPAKKDGNPVDCVFFMRFMVRGSDYPVLE